MAEKSKKKGKKHVIDAIAHIHASFNNTIITELIDKEMLYLGQPQEVVDLEGRGNLHLSLLR